MKGLYILGNPHLFTQSTIKIGMSIRLHERLFDYDATFTDNKYYYCYITNTLTREQILYIEKIILDETKHLRNKHFSSEYRNFNDDFTIEKYHNLIIDTLELFKINHQVKINPVFTKPKKTNLQQIESLDRTSELTNIKSNPFNISKRTEIQSKYLDKIISELDENHRVLCVAPTGFGKTRIFYNLLNTKTNLRTIIVFTPRILLCGQSANNKYTNILEKSYNKIVFNKSAHNIKKIKDCLQNNKRIIIYSCYQSAKKLYKLLKNNHIDLIVFDEAHFIQTWKSKTESNEEKDIYVNHFMKSNIIKNRLYLTATPTDTMLSNTNIFGKYINLVKVYELINYGILCNIETIVKKIYHSKKEYYDLYSLICSSMKKYNKKKGILYANTQDNAKRIYNLFNKKNKNNHIKAYIYISDSVDLYDDNDDSLEEFESDDNPCIIITCKKIDYGYDNIWIDFICFADPKSGDVEIRQIMGRGLRNDEKVYPNKILHVLLPIYSDETDKDNGYKHIVSYLKYIVEEAGQDLISSDDHKIYLTGNKFNIRTNNNDYDGDDIPPEICQMLSTTSYYKYDNFKRFLRENNVMDEISYNKLENKHKWMIEFGKIRERYKKFCFRDIHPCNRSFYWTEDKCIEAKSKALKILKNKFTSNRLKRMTAQKKLIEIHKINNKIPNIDLEWYYPNN